MTGAAQGMGAAEAARFVAEGARVVLTDVQEAAGRELAKRLGNDAHFIAHDVADEAAWARVVDTSCERFGGVDVLVNNAAIHHTRPIEQERAEDFERVLRVNVIGSFLGIQSVIAPMRARGGGSIVNKSSIAGMRGIPEHGAYGSSKWAVRGLTQVAASELGPDGIRVNSVHPGPIDSTGMFARPDDAALEEKLLKPMPMRRWGATEDIASLVLFLASDESSFITGTEHVIDGGRIVW